MTDNHLYGLFEVTGVEAEYMIVDRDTLKILPISEKLFLNKTGEYASDYTNGRVEWSNELVAHVIEIKSTKPERSLTGLADAFSENVSQINEILENYNAMLLPTASHPVMDPKSETILWQHDYKEIYTIFDSVFNCKSHGWANLQSIHINLPFRGDDEFAKLHAAIRLILPLIPSIAASSPLREGKLTGNLDSRMEAYFFHERKVPSLMGKLIPERVYTRAEYHNRIFLPIISDFKKFDPDNIMDHFFLNSRGAIARFDRGSIEIRVMDIQECPAADIALVEVINAAVKMLVSEKHMKLEHQKMFDEEDLLGIFMDSVKNGTQTEISSSEYLSVFGLSDKANIYEVWNKILSDVDSEISPNSREIIKVILDEGNLSVRIIKRLKENQSILSIYKELAGCLSRNIMFR